MKDKWPYFVGNQPQAPNADLKVTDKYSGDVATRVAMADAETIDQAIGAAVNAAELMRKMAPYERQAVLNHCVVRFEERAEEFLDSAVWHVTTKTAGDLNVDGLTDLVVAGSGWALLLALPEPENSEIPK